MPILEVFVKQVTPTRFSVHAITGEPRNLVESAEVQIDLDPDRDLSQDLVKLHPKDVFDEAGDRDKYEDLCIRVGTYLFSKLFDKIDDFYRKFLADQCYNAKGTDDFPRLMLHLPSLLHHLPWELLYDPDAGGEHFLALYGTITRVHPDHRRSKYVHTSTSKLRLVYFHASPDGKPISTINFDVHERLQLQTVLQVTARLFSDWFDKDRKQSTGLVPVGVILHGHGDKAKDDKVTSGQFTFVKSDNDEPDPRFARAVMPVLGGSSAKTLRTGVLLACDSAWTTKEVPFEFSLVGQVLKNTGLEFVIGMQRALKDGAAKEFAKSAINDLLENRSTLDVAIRKGRLTVKGLGSYGPETQRNYRDWWVPAVYVKTKAMQIITDEPPVDPNTMNAVVSNTPYTPTILSDPRDTDPREAVKLPAFKLLKMVFDVLSSPPK